MADLSSTLEALERLAQQFHQPGPAGAETGSKASIAARLRSLTGDPDQLELAFRLLLARTIKAGPSGPEVRPRDLLALAQAGIAAGALGAGYPEGFRRGLDRLAARLREVGAWNQEESLWWQPLAKSSFLEGLWARFQDSKSGLVLPETDAVATALGDDQGCRFLSLPELLGSGLTGHVHRELEAAYRDGGLPLERAGVGAGSEITAQRTDEVCYLSGFEPELLQSAPTTALLIQALLGPLARRLQRALPTVACFPPQTAMLARYPAPSRGYDAHLDNPGLGGGSEESVDNGRILTLVTYLNHPDTPPAGGEIALWSPGAPDKAPSWRQPPAGGSAVLFDSRRVPHQVRALEAGPARWALTVWLSDQPQGPPAALPVPELTVTDALLPIADPPLEPGTVLFHKLDNPAPSGRFLTFRTESVPSRSKSAPRLGIVSTVYRAGHGAPSLEAWCEHHLRLGVAHLLLVFDHYEDPQELAVAAALEATVAERWDRASLTIWSGARTAAERWPELAAAGVLGKDDFWKLVRLTAGGSSSHAVAARQSLHASAALEAARHSETGAAGGGAPLDWLLHLDADELLHLEGSGRGGATLEEHLHAAQAGRASHLRYLNHELLLPRGEVPAEPFSSGNARVGTARFKVNPRLAAARLGARGWSELVGHLGLRQDGPRPYFASYHNGKSAVAVNRARTAAGVHGWELASGDGAAARWLLAGPSILHVHCPTPEIFRRKYQAKARAPEIPGEAPFELSSLERAAHLELTGNGGAAMEGLFDARLTFTPEEVALLEEAGLLMEGRIVPE